MLVTLAEFLDDHPDLTHSFIEFTEKTLETENILIAVEEALRGHDGLIHLEIYVSNLVSQNFIDFY